MNKPIEPNRIAAALAHLDQRAEGGRCLKMVEEMITAADAARPRLEPTDADRLVLPEVQTIADNLMALVAIRDACREAGWRGSVHLCTALLIDLGNLVEAETFAGTEAHRIAVLAQTEDEEESP